MGNEVRYIFVEISFERSAEGILRERWKDRETTWNYLKTKILNLISMTDRIVSTRRKTFSRTFEICSAEWH